MPLALQHVRYEDLKARQQENFNFQKVSAVLAGYGFATIRLSDDWQGADFIAQHIDGMTFLKIQLKGRLTFDKKYMGKDLYITFFCDGYWYLYPHDELLASVLADSNIGNTSSWMDNGLYSFKSLSRSLLQSLLPYRLVGDVQTVSPENT